jgi:hypothetical protein
MHHCRTYLVIALFLTAFDTRAQDVELRAGVLSAGFGAAEGGDIVMRSTLGLLGVGQSANAEGAISHGFWYQVSGVGQIVAAPGVPFLTAPEDDDQAVPLEATLTWSAAFGATSYDVQLASDPTFSVIIVDSSGVSATSLDAGGLAPGTTYFWRVRAMNAAGTSPYSSTFSFTTLVTVAADDEAELPVRFMLEQNYPNPFNPSTVIAFSLPQAEHVRLDVYDVFGRRIMTVIEGPMNAGRHEIRLNAEDLASGAYIYRIDAGLSQASRTMMLIR